MQSTNVVTIINGGKIKLKNLNDSQDRNFNDEPKSNDNAGRNRWKGNQQLSGEGIQIVVDHVDGGEERPKQQQQQQQQQQKRPGN